MYFIKWRYKYWRGYRYIISRFSRHSVFYGRLKDMIESGKVDVITYTGYPNG